MFMGGHGCARMGRSVESRRVLGWAMKVSMSERSARGRSRCARRWKGRVLRGGYRKLLALVNI